MKQRITEDQFNELSKEKRQKWVTWCWDHHYTINKVYKDYIVVDDKMILGFPGIGEMIEFLEDNNKFEEEADMMVRPVFFWRQVGEIKNRGGFAIKWWLDEDQDITGELCDCLWEAVKEALEK
mgnify:CR=1 FL=1